MGNNIGKVRNGKFKYSVVPKGDIQYVDASHTEPFTVYLVEERKLEVKTIKDLTGGIGNMDAEKARELKEGGEKIESDKLAMSTLQKEKRARQSKIKAQLETLTTLKSNVKDMKKKLQKYTEESSKLSTIFSDLLQKFKSNEKVKLCERAIDILSTNNLVSDVEKIFDDYKRKLNSF